MLQQNSLVEELKKWCAVDADVTLDQKHQLDFILLRFRNFLPKVPQIGVQVTTNIDDINKLVRFYRYQGTILGVVDRSVYLELDDVNVQHGGALTVLGTLLELSLNIAHKQHRFAHVKVNRDLNYELRDSMALISEFEDDISRGIGRPHQGEIVYYSPAGKNGKIREGNKFATLYHFRIEHVADPSLRKELAGSETDRTNLRIHATFTSEGYRENQPGTYPVAVQIRTYAESQRKTATSFSTPANKAEAAMPAPTLSAPMGNTEPKVPDSGWPGAWPAQPAAQNTPPAERNLLTIVLESACNLISTSNTPKHIGRLGNELIELHHLTQEQRWCGYKSLVRMLKQLEQRGIVVHGSFAYDLARHALPAADGNLEKIRARAASRSSSSANI